MIVHGENSAAIFKAFAKAQAAIGNPVKDKAGFNYKYADLAATFEAALPHLNENGFTLVQPASSDYGHDGMIVAVETYLLHDSGGYLQFPPLTVKPAKADAQSVGSAITYLRRYTFSAIVGIAPEDDDGASASGKQTAQRNGSGHKPAQPRPEFTMDDVQPIDPGDEPAPTDKQHKMLFAVGNDLYGDEWETKRADLVGWATGHRTTSASELTRKEMSKLLDALKKRQEEAQAEAA